MESRVPVSGRTTSSPLISTHTSSPPPHPTSDSSISRVTTSSTKNISTSSSSLPILPSKVLLHCISYIAMNGTFPIPVLPTPIKLCSQASVVQ